MTNEGLLFKYLFLEGFMNLIINALQEMQSLDKDARGWDVYVGLDHALKDLVTALRAVTQLQNSAMRERHWAQLSVAMKVRELLK